MSESEERMATGEERRTEHAGEADAAERLRRELEAERQRMLRLRADFENVRRRMAGEGDESWR